MDRTHAQLQKKEFNYWRRYYRDTLDLPDWENRANKRTNRMFGDPSQITLLKDIGDLSMSRWLDAGCGTGSFLSACSRFIPSAPDLVGLDQSQNAVNILKQKTQELPTSVLSLRGSVLNLPFPEKYFSYIHCQDVLEHVPNTRLAIRELLRVLEPGGYLYIHVPDYRWPLEPHYKIWVFPNRKWLAKKLLRLTNRPTEYLDHLQFISPAHVETLIKETHFKTSIQHISPSSRGWKGSLLASLCRALKVKFDLLVRRTS